MLVALSQRYQRALMNDCSAGAMNPLFCKKWVLPFAKPNMNFKHQELIKFL
jgi:hypothetical protein